MFSSPGKQTDKYNRTIEQILDLIETTVAVRGIRAQVHKTLASFEGLVLVILRKVL